MAPRLAEMNASPVTQAGSDRPDSRKSSLVATARRAITPIVTTRAK